MHSRSRTALNIAIFVFFGNITTSALAEIVRIGGTGAALGTMTLLAAAFQKAHPEHSVRVLPSLGTSGGLKALQARAIDVAVSARDINIEEKSAGLSAFKYGVTAFIFVSHPKSSAQSLTKESLVDLYTGKQANWANGQPVRLVLRPKGDSDTKQLTKLSPEVEAAVAEAHAKNGMTIAITDTDAADQVEKTPGALSTSTLALVLSENRNFHILPFEGVTPNVATLNNGSYAHTKGMYVVISATASTGTKEFLQFMRSTEGTEILKKTGHKVPALL